MTGYFDAAYFVRYNGNHVKTAPVFLSRKNSSGRQNRYPVSLPRGNAIVTFSMISIATHWNDYFWPLIITDTDSDRTLTIGLGMFVQQESGSDWSLLMAATLFVCAPIIDKSRFLFHSSPAGGIRQASLIADGPYESPRSPGCGGSPESVGCSLNIRRLTSLR